MRPLTMFAVSAAIVACLSFGAGLPTKAVWVIGSLCAVCVGSILVDEIDALQTGPFRHTAVAALVVTVLHILAVIIVTQRAAVWSASVGLFSLSFFLYAIARAGKALLPALRPAPYLVFGVLIASALPVSFGPTLEHWYDASEATNAVVALSPASYLSSLVEYDYLRSEWFYQYTPYGAMRYDYPNPIGSTVLLLSAGIALCWAANAITTRRRRIESIISGNTPLEEFGL